MFEEKGVLAKGKQAKRLCGQTNDQLSYVSALLRVLCAVCPSQQSTSKTIYALFTCRLGLDFEERVSSPLLRKRAESDGETL